MEWIIISLVILIIGLAIFIPAVKRVNEDGLMRRMYRTFNEDREGKVTLDIYKVIYNFEKEGPSLENRNSWKIKDGDAVATHHRILEKKEKRIFGEGRPKSKATEDLIKQARKATASLEKEETETKIKSKKKYDSDEDFDESFERDDELEDLEINLLHDHEYFGSTFYDIKEHLNFDRCRGNLIITDSGYDFEKAENFQAFLILAIEELPKNASVIFPVNNSWVLIAKGITNEGKTRVAYSFSKKMVQGLK